jgi:RNA polymerase sigma factor (sigma-70 family)
MGFKYWGAYHLNKSIHELKSNRGKRDSEDLVLLQRVATKDKLAFESLYARSYQQLSRYLMRLIRRPELVEEAINDTMFVVWEKAEKFEGRSKVATWITGIAYFKGIKALDKLKKMPEQKAESLYETDDIEENYNLIKRLGLENWLESGLDLISADQRSVVELTCFSGYSYQEIADLIQCPVNTVKTRMFHARRRLAKLLPLLLEQTEAEVETLSSFDGALDD